MYCSISLCKNILFRLRRCCLDSAGPPFNLSSRSLPVAGRLSQPSPAPPADATLMLNIQLECAEKEKTSKRPRATWLLDWENPSKVRWPTAKVAHTSVRSLIVQRGLQLGRLTSKSALRFENGEMMEFRVSKGIKGHRTCRR